MATPLITKRAQTNCRSKLDIGFWLQKDTDDRPIRKAIEKTSGEGKDGSGSEEASTGAGLPLMKWMAICLPQLRNTDSSV